MQAVTLPLSRSLSHSDHSCCKNHSAQCRVCLPLTVGVVKTWLAATNYVKRRCRAGRRKEAASRCASFVHDAAAAAAHVSNNVDAPIRQKHLLLAETDTLSWQKWHEGGAASAASFSSSSSLLFLHFLPCNFHDFQPKLSIKRGGEAEGREVAWAMRKLSDKLTVFKCSTGEGHMQLSSIVLCNFKYIKNKYSLR